MKRCDETKDLLIDYACREISARDMQKAEHHLRVCSDCKKEYRQYQKIFESMGYLGQESETLMKGIDWNKNAQDISRSIRLRSRSSRTGRAFSFTFNILNWKALVPIAAAVFLLGLLSGYFLFQSSPGENLSPLKPADQFASLERLETTLAQREVSSYFEEAHLVLTDLLRQCDARGAVFQQDRLNRQRVKLLLNRSKYFNQNLDNPRLLSSKSLLKKIEWLLYEILTLEDSVSCRQLQRLQDYIRQERLLLKIRLIGRDITEV